MANRAGDNLALLDRETARLLAAAESLTTGDLQEPTLCPGWNTAALLTHLARNADALLNLVRWALDGQERNAYASEEARAADIDAGAGRPLAQIVADLRGTAHRFREEAEELRGPAGEASVRSRTGTAVTGAQVIAMRSLEVIFHHVDLQTGFTFEDVDPSWVARTLARGARQWEASGTAPALTLSPQGLAAIELAGGGPEVSGTPGAVLLWLARGVDQGLTSEVALPTPPAWA